VEYGTEISRIPKQNSLVISGGYPGNRHNFPPLGDGSVAGENDWKGLVVLAEIDNSGWVRDLVGFGARIPGKIVALP